MLKVNLIITSEWCHWCRSGVSIVNFEQTSHIVLMFPLSIFNKWMPAQKVHGRFSGVFIVNFEQILAIDQVFSLLTSYEYPGLPQI